VRLAQFIVISDTTGILTMQLKEQACVCVHPSCEIRNKCSVLSEFWKSFLIIIVMMSRTYLYTKCPDLYCCIMFAEPPFPWYQNVTRLQNTKLYKHVDMSHLTHNCNVTRDQQHTHFEMKYTE
jgi:hypothetical protein